MGTNHLKEGLCIECEEQENTVCFLLDGELTYETSAHVVERILEVFNTRPAPATVLVNICELRWIDSTGIGTLVRLLAISEARNGRLAYFGRNLYLTQKLRDLHLHRAVPVHETPEAALAECH